MPFHTCRAAIAALTLAISSAAFASSLYLGSGSDPNGGPSSSITGYTVAVTNGNMDNSFLPGEPPVFSPPTDVSKFSYTLDLSPAPSVTATMADGTVDGTFIGHYTISYDGTLLSAGTVAAHGTETFVDDGNGSFFPTDVSFIDGLFTQTSGTGIPGFAPGTTAAAFEGRLAFDGNAYFQGSLSDAPAATAVPLPASALTGLTLTTLLAAGRLVRRRSLPA